MARNDLVLQLVKSGVSGDRDAARRVAEALVADERSKQHTALADRLESAIKTAPKAPASLLNLPREDIVGLQARAPHRTLDTICLTELNRTFIDEFVEEQERADLLRSNGIEPRHTMLLVGPPGCGKTTLAEAMASALCLPLNIVKYDTLVGSYLGETSARLRRVFEYARTNPCVLFFDEFDAIGKERGDASDVGELKRVVASLLTQIDDMPATSVVVCATRPSNHKLKLTRRAIEDLQPEGRRYRKRAPRVYVEVSKPFYTKAEVAALSATDLDALVYSLEKLRPKKQIS